MKGPELWQAQQAACAQINAELQPKPATRIPEVKRFSGTAPNGDRVVAIVNYGDGCGNGHNTLSITGTVWYAENDKHTPLHSGRLSAAARQRLREGDASGCVHEDIARAIPELAPLLRWHLTSTDGPMHYLANAIHLAGDRDCRGRAAGEPSAWQDRVRFADSPVSHCKDERFLHWLRAEYGSGRRAFEVVAVEHKKEPGGYNFGPKYTFAGFPGRRADGIEWHECPFDSKRAAQEWAEALARCAVTFTREATTYSEGKARELDGARRAAVWPDATDAQLSVPPDELAAVLLARLPGLMREFKAAVESFGFTY